MNKIVRGIGVSMLVIGLIVIRAYENTFFYDPLLSFFKSGHLSQSLPELDLWKLLGHVSIRFWINSILSLGVLWLLFKNEELLKVAFFLYGIFYFVLIFLFYFVIRFSDTDDFLFLFYLRRFLIQPVLLLLLIPAFYFFQKKKNKDI